MRTTTIAAVIALSGTISSAALAGPPPMSEEELFEYSEVVADVESIQLDCMGPPEVGEYSTVRNYIALLEPTNILKGDPGTAMIEVEGYETEYAEGNGVSGCSAPEYVLPQGWVGRVYLQSTGDGRYYIEQWGGADIDAAASVTHEVPTCEVVPPNTDPNPDGEDPRVNPSGTSEAGSEAASCAMSGSGLRNDSRNPLWAALLAIGAVIGLRRRR